MANPRKIALKALLDLRQNSAYSNISLNAAFALVDLTPKDKALTTAIFYGVLDRTITLDYVLSSFIKTPLKKVSPITLEILRLSLYQIMFMDKIPDSAAVNEAIKMVKSSKERYNAAFINGVLRNILRSDISLPQDDDIKSLSIRFSCPEWIVDSFIKDYGLEDAKQLLTVSLENPPVTVRVNTLKTTSEELIADFEKTGIIATKTTLDNALEINGGINIATDQLYKNGHYYVQDLASQMAIKVLNPQKEERLLDMCAAPGGKSFLAAISMMNTGEINSCDIHKSRVDLITKGAERLGIKTISSMLCDATAYYEYGSKFDTILCDVPCSGLGVIRRKPEIKYKDISEYNDITVLQKAILNNAVNYLKDSGRLLYSTCTLRKCENQDIVYDFLKNNSDFKLEYEHTFMPHIDGTDGFYCALLQKSR